MSLMASILVSGNEMLQENSERHFTASWKLPTTASKYCSNTLPVVILYRYASIQVMHHTSIAVVTV